MPILPRKDSTYSRKTSHWRKQLVMRSKWCMAVCMICALWACTETNSRVADSIFSPETAADQSLSTIDLPEIEQNGELVVLTMYGPTSYFEYRGGDFGNQYQLAQKFSQALGVAMRLEVCRNREEMVRKLADGEGDVIAYGLNTTQEDSVEIRFCGTSAITHLTDSLDRMVNATAASDSTQRAWAVRESAPLLAEALEKWLVDHDGQLVSLSSYTMARSTRYAHRPAGHAQSPLLDPSRGIISQYDALFKRHAPTAGFDWRLLAAQCYQESAFNPGAESWMGAMGLMQLMPATARQMGVADAMVYDPASNIRGAARFLAYLDRYYSSIPHGTERLCFVLAAYNAGPGHVDDARRLAAKHGYNPNRWAGNVAPFVLRMSDSRYYAQPEVEHGYFRGEETFNYVEQIMQRWQFYRTRIK